MTNALTTTTSGALANPNFNPFLDAADDMGASAGLLFLKFDGNTGSYTYGKDDDELEKGTRVAVNPSEFKNGWICWKDGQVMEETMTRIVDGKPTARGDLADHGPYEDEKDGWREQSSVQLRDIESGDEFLFKTSSKGGRIAVGNLVRDFGKAYAMHPGELAIVELSSTSFDAKDKKTGKKLGKKFAPAFKIVGWASEADLIAKFDAMGADEGDAGPEDDDELPVNTAAKRGARRF
jgi:hypothetical protein